MKKVLLFLLLLNSGFSIPAFPGAEGFGSQTPGGRGGKVIIVSNLEDSGPGSFRAAVASSGPRIVVFNVSGNIRLATPITVLEPYLTIAGQTSPGGVAVSGLLFEVSAHDVVVRHMRFRMGSDVCDHITGSQYGNCQSDGDAVRVAGSAGHPAYNVVFDHCSMSWGCDETVDIAAWYGETFNVTFSHCLIAEGLDDPAEETNHGYGLLISGKYSTSQITVSLHHNFIANFRARFPEIGSNSYVDVRNDVIYNWENGLSQRFDHLDLPHSYANFVHNYAKPGHISNSCARGESAEIFFCDHLDPEGKCHAQDTNAYPAIYANGNIGCARSDQSEPDWQVLSGWSPFNWLSESWRKTTPFEAPLVTTSAMDADYALQVIAEAGATKPVRDSADLRFVAEYMDGTGGTKPDMHYPTGWPTFPDIAPPIDTDKDGMADGWETANGQSVGTDDSKGDIDSDGYTNIEDYLVYLTGDCSDPIDRDCDGLVEDSELFAMIDAWKRGEKNINELLEAIMRWKR